MEEARRRIRTCSQLKEKGLFLEHLGLTELPDDLPDSLRQFSCSGNSFHTLPKLPTSLKYLYCSYNKTLTLSNLLVNGLVTKDYNDMLIQMHLKSLSVIYDTKN
ncbi:MAG: hypothetical protein Dasosvirus16_1 [Dasosvirus sp.]|uniref:Leucine-rich repeat protein n=1 Tax=Dasosvirus sp. TaxID=2487764 RepID=A0A3G4ZTI4_9VIRU|nr:MAG: hypothetical protein Dasosvirus16_1 [Dasosvirus sp.]